MMASDPRATSLDLRMASLSPGTSSLGIRTTSLNVGVAYLGIRIASSCVRVAYWGFRMTFSGIGVTPLVTGTTSLGVRNGVSVFWTLTQPSPREGKEE